MAKITYTITVDDYDRESCPEAPWTATVDGSVVASGFGDTVLDAIRNLFERADYGDIPTPVEACEVCGAPATDEVCDINRMPVGVEVWVRVCDKHAETVSAVDGEDDE